MWPRPKKGKPEDSKTVRQWALMGRIPIEGARPSYIWEAEDRAQTIYFHLRDTREMTEEEEAVFLADMKGYSERYVKMFSDEKGRVKYSEKNSTV